MYSNIFKRNGEIIDIKQIKDDYFIAVDIGHRFYKIHNYNHVKKVDNTLVIANEDLGNEVSIDEETNLAIIRDPKKGKYLYSIADAKRLSPYFQDMYFMNNKDEKYVCTFELTRNTLGNNYGQLLSLLNLDGTFATDVLNEKNGKSYGSIETEEDYYRLKDGVRRELDKPFMSRESAHKKLLELRRKK